MRVTRVVISAAMQRHAAEHPRAFGSMLDLAIPDERDY